MKNTPNSYRERYEKNKDMLYDSTMEYIDKADVGSGSWVLITRQVPVDKKCRPHLFGIYWGVPTQDRFDRQVCVIHTTEDVTLLNHEFTVIDEEKLKMYREEGWELKETHAQTEQQLDMELLEKGRTLCEEEREVIWALQLDGLSEMQSCEEYFLTKHTDYNNYSICYIPNTDTYDYLISVFGER